MDATIPASIQPLLADYLHALEPLQAHFYGIYIYGSIALGAFEEMESDVDIVALTQGEWTERKLIQLTGIHSQLRRQNQFGDRLASLYIPLTDIGKNNAEVAPYPYAAEGKFHTAGHFDLNPVTWWIIKNKGIRLLGPGCDALPLDVTWDDVLSTMRFNLEVYFARKIKYPYIYLYDAGVEFAVTNMCRIFTTIEDGEIISKSASLVRWRERLPARWRPLLEEARRIRHHLSQRSLYRSRLQRMQEMLAFIQYGRQRGIQALDASSFDRSVR